MTGSWFRQDRPLTAWPEGTCSASASWPRLELPLLLPGIKLISSPTGHRPIKQMRLVRFNGERYVLFSDVLASE